MFTSLLSVFDRLSVFQSRSTQPPGTRRPRSRRKRTYPVLEALEDRTLLSTISGRVFEDVTGDGATPDDPPLAGWRVNLTRHELAPLVDADFNDGSGAVSLDGFAATGGWHVTPACGGIKEQPNPDAAPPGVVETCMDSGADAGDLTSVPIALPIEGISAVAFLYRLGELEGSFYGTASLQVSGNGGDFTTLASTTDGTLSTGASLVFWFDLSDYAGQNVVLRFHLEPDPTAAIAAVGWQLDDVTMTHQFSVDKESDALGNYSFTDVMPGTYELVGLGPYGWRETAAPTAVIVITDHSQTFDGYEFAAFDMGRISGHVFSDDDGNGHRDPGEAGLNGFRIDVYDGSGELITSTYTDETDSNGDGVIDPITEMGIYELAGLAGGDYSLIVNLTDGWTQTGAGAHTITFTGTQSGESSTGHARGVRCPAGTVCPMPQPPGRPLPRIEICGDRIDNDGDGQTDVWRRYRQRR